MDNIHKQTVIQLHFIGVEARNLRDKIKLSANKLDNTFVFLRFWWTEPSNSEVEMFFYS